ncbi:hypothetical protein CTI12_AA582610 [Artemisia annua]|uniref:Reverse transcriptase domain-containing protein n=1 Tax=Artemisia annua TaxID=35608 RepID=A0A2U1KNF1_ARTAN|nr:hypothetical protein CTI12_AA582610 [Artemisia annua]
MAPRTRRTTTATPSATMTPAEIQQAIVDGINAALAEQAATARNEGAGAQPARNVAPAPRQCTYNDFTACQPMYKRHETVF